MKYTGSRVGSGGVVAITSAVDRRRRRKPSTARMRSLPLAIASPRLLIASVERTAANASAMPAASSRVASNTSIRVKPRARSG